MKRIFILSRDSLFLRGIETLLSQETDLELLCRDDDLDSVVEKILAFQPEAILINCDDPEEELRPAIHCILHQRLGIRIIGLSLKDNQISVFRGEKKEVRQVEDLLRAIQD